MPALGVVLNCNLKDTESEQNFGEYEGSCGLHCDIAGAGPTAENERIGHFF